MKWAGEACVKHQHEMPPEGIHLGEPRSWKINEAGALHRLPERRRGQSGEAYRQITYTFHEDGGISCLHDPELLLWGSPSAEAKAGGPEGPAGTALEAIFLRPCLLPLLGWVAEGHQPGAALSKSPLPFPLGRLPSTAPCSLGEAQARLPENACEVYVLSMKEPHKNTSASSMRWGRCSVFIQQGCKMLLQEKTALSDLIWPSLTFTGPYLSLSFILDLTVFSFGSQK